MKVSLLAKRLDRVSRAKNDASRIELLAELFGAMDEPSLRASAHLTAGELAPPELGDRLGIGPGTLRDAIAELSKREPAVIEDRIREVGDLSEVVSEFARGKDELTVAQLWKRVLRAIEAGEERRSLVRDVFARTSRDGARYFARAALNQLRIGVGIGTIVRALAAAFDVEARAIEHFYVMSNDIGEAAVRAKKGRRALAKPALALFHPYRFMTAHKIDEVDEIFARLPEEGGVFEVKYDGVRLQVHLKTGKAPEVRLYSRRLTDESPSMPDVVAAVPRAWKGGDAILEGEVLAYDPSGKHRLPFQAVMMRVGRKHDVGEMTKQIPLVLHVFDLVYIEGESLMDLAYGERRKRLKKLLRETARVKLAEGIETADRAAQERYFREVVAAGHEGLMAKDPRAVYTPGKRTEAWMKIKPAFETLDVVVVGAIWGSGRRRSLLSSLVVAVRDRGGLKAVGKVGTGFSEEALRALTARLAPLITATRGREVEIEPTLVLEVDFQDIQKTDAYESGYALRIPRFRRERTDKSVGQADTLARLVRLYESTHAKRTAPSAKRTAPSAKRAGRSAKRALQAKRARAKRVR